MAKVQIAVEYFDHQFRYYPVPMSGWRIDAASRHLIIGKGLPRKYVPLDRVVNWSVESIEED